VLADNMKKRPGGVGQRLVASRDDVQTIAALARNSMHMIAGCIAAGTNTMATEWQSSSVTITGTTKENGPSGLLPFDPGAPSRFEGVRVFRCPCL
jgi:hypothetical protein